ncbi:plasmid pRiA4b ORF-3 family protein [Vibrio sp. S9_S30]|uniref:plasmid pRiA4b ORF-3 family protein n=1 Tax=Vibrio sp. S9_S30 TaxID=2720226 RepID=UPI001680D9F6|nr:plasmid pRiA4b ORF-3 family protein [Vibrio sp. S9_S30]MBD1559938.1 plasmid pRiA4b ORF-3 family protein [Vibrio sp. S9_S30]
MKIYSIKVALCGVSPMIWRRLRIAGNTSLASLHYIIQITQGWDDEHLHQFHIYGKDYGISYSGGLSFSDNANKVYIDDFKFDVGDRFTYEYNFFEHWLHDIRIEAIDEMPSRKRAPFCLSGNGMPGATEYDAYQKMMALLKGVTKSNKTTTVGALRPYVEALNAVRFNRNQVNHDMVKLDAGKPSLHDGFG